MMKIIPTNFMLLFLLIFSACDENPELSLPDMTISSLAFQNGGAINVGDVVDMNITIPNVEDSSNEAGTMKAGISHLGAEVFFREDENSPWNQKVAQMEYVTPEIKAGAMAINKVVIAFDVAGEYFVSAEANIRREVDERNFSNNQEESDGAGTRAWISPPPSRIIKVLPTEAFYLKIRSKQNIPFITIIPQSDLITSRVENYQ